VIRRPLRPLARVLKARAQGENPDAIERENLRQRLEEMRDNQRHRAEGRLLVMVVLFVCGFGIIGTRMAVLAGSSPVEPRAVGMQSHIVSDRADILDRNGRILATNLDTYSLYAQTRDMIEPERAAHEVARIFPDLDADALAARFSRPNAFMWIKTRLSPEQMQAVHDIGEPGLMFGPREMRLYPNGALAAHVLGGARFGEQAVNSAEVKGVAGVELAFDNALRDPANNGAPLVLSIDLTIQSAVEDVLEGGMKLLNAKGAAAVLMDVHTGELVAMASLPDFDPNERPALLTQGDQADSPLFNRAVQGVYELGSTYKIFTVAQAMELGLVNPGTMVDANAPMTWGRFTINEFRRKNYGPLLSVTDVIVKSSNVGTARLALQIGGERQQEFFRALGLFDPLPVELAEAPHVRPLRPARWSDIVTITASYGHGIAASPLHLAAAYASLLNGGTRVAPTLMRRDAPAEGPRLVSEHVSQSAATMLRAVVERGTASFGEVAGYSVGGKTGTADKPKPGGGYYDDRVVATFASVFPSNDPRYVLVVTMDEPVETAGSAPRRTAGWTSVPVAAEIIRRTAPLLGLRPQVELGQATGVTLTSNH